MPDAKLEQVAFIHCSHLVELVSNATPILPANPHFDDLPVGSISLIDFRDGLEKRVISKCVTHCAVQDFDHKSLVVFVRSSI